MGVWNVALGLGVENNPIVDSPYVQQFDIGVENPPPPTGFMITETGLYMLTESGSNLMILE